MWKGCWLVMDFVRVAKVNGREAPRCRFCCQGTLSLLWPCPDRLPQPEPSGGSSRAAPGRPALARPACLLTRRASSARCLLPRCRRFFHDMFVPGEEFKMGPLPPKIFSPLAAPASPPSCFHPRSPSPESQLSSTFPSSWCYELPHFFQNPAVNPCSHIPLVL